ncbi:uncharacterized protein APUU_51039S [Aspergillus puulaauensis]|uniref:Transaldolase n=1 Tax=Aspergillus puulaauensis TaxID=1220207 RepID=A0A7R7XSW0_9EURO|nr:uncharacterized protein APUU_51039S [Aspergillus puulaauensis]BCS26328.1 hypothetical protein APUU_51039S [Aspergillus puulaauensis]
MAATTVPTWLHKLEEQVNVDADAMDPDFIKSLPIVPHDMTSNQIHVHGRMSDPSNRQLLLDVAQEYKDRDWLAVYTRAAVLLCKKNIDLIQGRVLLQASPSQAYNAQKVLEHARLYAKEFESVGISKDRFCIKIPSTGPALSVCPILEAEGIRTLGTAVFSLAQAIAASQAGCLFISPYFNEIRANLDLSLWPNVEDPATQHTMSARLLQMLETYRRLYKETGKPQPLIKNANFISPKEALAQGEIGVDSATVSQEVLAELAKLPYDGSSQAPGVIDVPKPAYPEHQNSVSATPKRLRHLAGADPLAAADWDGKLASTDIDYLASDGANLESAISADPIASARMRDALGLFVKIEGESKELIEGVLKEVS